ncbi:MAG: energy transducer TonB [Pseudobdellovibrionaceae bacterium]
MRGFQSFFKSIQIHFNKLNLSFKKSIIFSILIHLFTFLFLLMVGHFKPEPLQYTTIDIDFQDVEKMDLKKLDEILDRQIVQQDERSVNETEPDKAKFLSAKNQNVKKETVAQNRGEFRNANKAQAQGENQKQKNSENAKVDKNLNTFRGDETKSKNGADKKIALMKELSKPYDPSGMFDKVEKQQLQAASSQSPQGTRGEASQTNDYLKGKDPGLETLLKTKEFKYYTYYNRIRRRLSEYWEPAVKEKMDKMFKQGRSIASTEEKVTKLLIILNEKGILTKVQVVMDSGVRDLDEAAIEAFKLAAPFPNPPQGIADADGTIKIRWDFILES